MSRARKPKPLDAALRAVARAEDQPQEPLTPLEIGSVVVPLEVRSEANIHEHWAVRAKRVKGQRAATWAALQGKGKPRTPVLVTLTRVLGSRAKVMDDDNLARSFKAVRDEIAAHVGVDDGAKEIVFVYAQRKPEEKTKRGWIEIRFTEVPL